MSIKISELAGAIEKELTLQQKSSTEAVKKAASESAREIKDDVKKHAPVGRTGKYAKSWRTKKTEETITSVSYVVHAGPSGYRLAHLLEDSTSAAYEEWYGTAPYEPTLTATPVVDPDPEGEENNG